MNYNSMNCLSDGIIIEELNTGKIIYINPRIRDILKISNDKTINSMSEILHNNGSDIEEKVKQDLNEKDLAEGLVYFKTSNDMLAETSFRCRWFDQSKDLALYVFKNSVEIVDNTFNFQEVTEHLPSGVMVMNIEPELFVTYANEEQYKILDMDNDREEFNKVLKYSIYEEDRDWVMAEIYDNLYKGLDVDIEFRMKGKRNSVKWVRLFGRARESATGERLFYSSLKDLSSRREINDKLHLERVMFRKITDLSDEVLFRIDLQSNMIYFIGKGSKAFSDQPVLENFPNCIIDSGMIFPDDMSAFLDVVECFKKGVHKYVEIRYQLEDRELEWYKIIYNFVKDSEGKPLLVIGKLVNINDHKILEEQAKKDLLTGFYNKIVTEIEINNLITDTEITGEHALFIIDLDYFKSINDNLGHHFGDYVLRDVAQDIKNCFRKDDIFGRIGGDEFIVVMKSCSDMSIVMEKATQICNALQKSYMGENENYSISASVGIAISPIDGNTFETLYQMADKALYHSKENGRNCFTRYNTTFITNTSRATPEINHDCRRKNDLIDHEIATTSFNLLYNSKDIKASLLATLKYLGEQYDVDRCYIFELDEANPNDYINTFIWESDKVPINTNVQCVDQTLVDNLFVNSNRDGVFYTNDVSTIADETALKLVLSDKIESVFLMKLPMRSKENAFFGIDDCTKKRIWSERDVKTLYQVARTIHMALSHYRDVIKLKDN